MNRRNPKTTALIARPNDPWNHPYKARAICPDGAVRIVRLSLEPSTVATWPARGRVAAGGSTVRGYVTQSDDGEIHFREYTRE